MSKRTARNTRLESQRVIKYKTNISSLVTKYEIPLGAYLNLTVNSVVEGKYGDELIVNISQQEGSNVKIGLLVVRIGIPKNDTWKNIPIREGLSYSVAITSYGKNNYMLKRFD